MAKSLVTVLPDLPKDYLVEEVKISKEITEMLVLVEPRIRYHQARQITVEGVDYLFPYTIIGNGPDVPVSKEIYYCLANGEIIGHLHYCPVHLSAIHPLKKGSALLYNYFRKYGETVDRRPHKL